MIECRQMDGAKRSPRRSRQAGRQAEGGTEAAKGDGWMDQGRPDQTSCSVIQCMTRNGRCIATLSTCVASIYIRASWMDRKQYRLFQGQVSTSTMIHTFYTHHDILLLAACFALVCIGLTHPAPSVPETAELAHTPTGKKRS